MFGMGFPAVFWLGCRTRNILAVMIAAAFWYAASFLSKESPSFSLVKFGFVC